jgi:hypothetical protein
MLPPIEGSDTGFIVFTCFLRHSNSRLKSLTPALRTNTESGRKDEKFIGSDLQDETNLPADATIWFEENIFQ